jgi:hypothetical protein
VERDGPMCRSDCPDGEDARRAVRLEERVWDFVRRDVSFELRRGVERDVSDWAQASPLSVCDDGSSSSWSILSLLLLSLSVLLLVSLLLE